MDCIESPFLTGFQLCVRCLYTAPNYRQEQYFATQGCSIHPERLTTAWRQLFQGLERRPLHVTNQTFRDNVPRETKAYAIAKPARLSLKVIAKQPLQKAVLNFRSQEVSRKMASKSADMTFVGWSRSGGLHEKPRKTWRSAGSSFFFAESLQPVSWRARTYANTNALHFEFDAI
jgi:hypothetical protein